MKRNRDKVDISVLICTKNRHDLCLRALDSLAANTSLPKKVIIVDTTPKPSLEKTTKTQSWPFAVEVHTLKSTHGLGFSRNFAIKKVKTPFFAFLDDDEVAPRSYIRKIKAELIDKKRDVIAGYMKSSFPKNYWNQIWDLIWKKMNFYEGKIKIIPAGCSAFRTKKIQNMIFFDERMVQSGEEEQFSEDLLSKNIDIYFIKSFFVLHDFRKDAFSFAKQFFLYGKSFALYSKITKKNFQEKLEYSRYLRFRISCDASLFSKFFPGILLKNICFFTGFFLTS